MPDQIVVAVEAGDAFAPVPGCALDCAGRVAARIGAEVSLVHVEPDVGSELAGLTPYRYEGVVEAEVREHRRRSVRTEAELHTLEHRVADRWSVHAEAVVGNGPVRTTTERLARLRHGDLLVARNGTAPCQAGYLAALPERVVWELEIPVLFLRAGTCHLLDELERAVVLLDGSDYAEKMLPLVQRLLPPTGRLHLLLVLPPHAPPVLLGGSSPRITTRTEGEAYLDGLTGRPELTGAEVDWTVSAGAPLADAIHDVVASARANVVSTMVRRPGPLAAILRGAGGHVLADLLVPLLLWRSSASAPPAPPRAH